jgi:CPA1 family monovalent cation:H+ antiporter
VHLELSDIAAVFALLVGAVVVAGLAERTRISAPIVLVIVGLAVSQVPGVPEYELNPEVVLFFFLPPLLYAAAWQSSVRSFRNDLRAITLLSVGLVLATTAAVGFAAWALIPGLPLAAGFALGAIIAPPDAIAASAVGRELGLPRRLMTILSGESLLNDATALTALRVAIAAVAGGITLLEAGEMLVVAAVGGAAVGLAIGWALHRVRRWLQPVLENALSLFVPFVAYLAAEVAHASGVVAVVVAGLYLSRTSTTSRSATRLQGWSTWELINFVLEAVVFLLIGLQLPAVLESLSRDEYAAADTLVWSLAILALVVVVRFAWVFPATYLPRRLSRRIRERDPAPPWSHAVVVSWAGMRGVVSLAAAFALAADFPQRDLILFITFVVVFGTLVLQGLTLPWVIRRLGVVGREAYTDRLAEANAQHRAVRAGVDRLDQLLAEETAPPPVEIVDKLRTQAEHRANGAWERIGDATTGRETPSALYRRLRTEMLRAERDEFVRLRDRGELDDEVLRAVVRDLDLEEAMLTRFDANA